MFRSRAQRTTGRLAGVLLLAVAALVGCSTTTVWSEHDPRATFDGMTRYAWSTPQGAASADERTDDPILDARIRRAVDAEMARRGFEEVAADAADAADFLVAYAVGIADRQIVTSVYEDRGSAYAARQRTRRRMVYEYEEGTLSLDFIDPGTGRPVWRGAARAEVDRSGTQADRDRRIADAVRKMLDQFPPK